MNEHDDELRDFGGIADVAVIAVSVAQHVAAVALLHRSARPLADRSAASAAAAIVVSRLARRGDAPLSARLERALPALGTERFRSTVARAAANAAARLRAVPPRQLAHVVGEAAAMELRASGAPALPPGGSLPAPDLEALAAHLSEGAELAVGIAGGAVFPRSEEAPHQVLEMAVEHLPDPRRPSRVSTRSLVRRGESAAEVDVPATLILVMRAGPTELRVSRDGRNVGGALILDGVAGRLRVTVEASAARFEPMPQDERVAAMRTAAEDWRAVSAEVQRDAVLAEVIYELYTHPGFGGSAEVLRALLDLAPLVHRHPEVARRFAREAPRVIHDPMAEVVAALAARLRAAGH